MSDDDGGPLRWTASDDQAFKQRRCMDKAIETLERLSAPGRLAGGDDCSELNAVFDIAQEALKILKGCK